MDKLRTVLENMEANRKQIIEADRRMTELSALLATLEDAREKMRNERHELEIQIGKGAR